MSDTVNHWPWPRLIAHRGAGRRAPENTLASMRLGAQHGFTMVEYDVKLSKDDVAVLLHDDSVERTSNGVGDAAHKTFAELARLDFGAWHSRAYAGEPIPTLQNIAAYTLANGLHSNIEIKPHTGQEAHTGQQVAHMARRLWADASVPPLLSSFSEEALDAAMREAPALPRALLIEHEVPADWLDRVQRLGCIGLNLNDKHTTHDLVRAIRDEGHTVAVWTVNDYSRALELLEWGCNGIFTDEIVDMAPARFT